MRAREAGGNATRQRASAPQGRAAALLFVSRCCSQSPLTWTPTGQASACKPIQQASAPWQGFKATAPQGFEPARAAGEVVSIEDAPSVRSTDSRKPRILFNPAEGLSMEKSARALFRSSSKFVPLVRISRISETTSGASRKQLIQRMYTLCVFVPASVPRGNPSAEKPAIAANPTPSAVRLKPEGKPAQNAGFPYLSC